MTESERFDFGVGPALHTWEEPERFLIRLEGGPAGGETRVATSDNVYWQWPLPGVISWDATGGYVKVRESSLPPQAPGSHVMRGATYEWKAG